MPTAGQLAAQKMLEAEQAVSTVERWIEALQILAGADDNPTEEQRAAMRCERQPVLDLFAHAQAELIRAHVWRRWPQEYTSGETAADLIDPLPKP